MNNSNVTIPGIKGTSKLVRPRFGPGMLLQHEDLELLNTYTRDLSRLLFGSLFGWGWRSPVRAIPFTCRRIRASRFPKTARRISMVRCGWCFARGPSVVRRGLRCASPMMMRRNRNAPESEMGSRSACCDNGQVVSAVVLSRYRLRRPIRMIRRRLDNQFRPLRRNSQEGSTASARTRRRHVTRRITKGCAVASVMTVTIATASAFCWRAWIARAIRIAGW
jgi:hypothetical protein